MAVTVVWLAAYEHSGNCLLTLAKLQMHMMIMPAHCAHDARKQRSQCLLQLGCILKPHAVLTEQEHPLLTLHNTA